MANVLLIVLLIISIIMTGLILIQQSEGGALGIGGGGGGGGLMSGRSAANSVGKMTAILGGLFLVCSLLLSVVFNREAIDKGLIDRVQETTESESPTENSQALTVDPLTDEADSVETTDPLADANIAAESGDNSDETPEDAPE